MNGGRRLKAAIKKWQGGDENTPTLKPQILTIEWAVGIERRLSSLERNMRIMNSGLFVAIVTDIVLGLMEHR